jgi:hypothetical protein
MTDRANTKPKWVHRNKWTRTDGTECEGAYLRDTHNLGVDELEALGHEALRAQPSGGEKLPSACPRRPRTRYSHSSVATVTTAIRRLRLGWRILGR